MLIEDKASGTQPIQELIVDSCHGVFETAVLSASTVPRLAVDRPKKLLVWRPSLDGPS